MSFNYFRFSLSQNIHGGENGKIAQNIFDLETKVRLNEISKVITFALILFQKIVVLSISMEKTCLEKWKILNCSFV